MIANELHVGISIVPQRPVFNNAKVRTSRFICNKKNDISPFTPPRKFNINQHLAATISPIITYICIIKSLARNHEFQFSIIHSLIKSNDNHQLKMKTELEKCLAGEPFFGGDPEIAEIAAKAKRLTRELNETAYTDIDRKRDIMRQLFGRMGRRVHIDVDFHCEYGRHILIGDRVIINMNCTFVDNNIIEIGNDVLIASNVQIYTATHSTRYAERMLPDDGSDGCEFCLTYAKPVKICDGAWLGGGVIVLPGVTIGRNSVIGAGSVVTRSIPNNCVAVGNPCRVIKTVDNGER